VKQVNDTIKVSVVVPMYNRGHCLPRLLKSIHDQTYKIDEIILVDDASTDDTVEIISNLNNPQIKLITLKENVGGGAARNVGISNSTGDFIAFLDSDDIWHSKKIEKQLDIIKSLPNKDNIIIFTKSRYMPEEYIIPKNNYNHDVSAFENMFFNMGMMQTSGLLVEKKLAKRAKFSRISVHQDYDFIVKCEKAGALFYSVNEPLYDFIADQFDSRVTSYFLAKKSLWWVMTNSDSFNEKMIKHYIKKYNIFERLLIQESIPTGLIFIFRFIYTYFNKLNKEEYSDIFNSILAVYYKNRLKKKLNKYNNSILVIYGSRTGLKMAIPFIKKLKNKVNFIVDKNTVHQGSVILGNTVLSNEELKYNLISNKSYLQIIFLTTALNENTFKSMKYDIDKDFASYSYKLINLHRI